MARISAPLADTNTKVVAYGHRPLRPPLQLVPPAGSPDAPAALEPGAAPHVVAFYRGYTCAMSGQAKKALEFFRKAIELRSDFADAHFNLGWALVETGQVREAVAALRKASELTPDFAAHLSLAWALAETGQVREAVAALRKASELKPDDADAHYSVGCALAEIGEFAEAVAPLRKASELKPDDAEAHFNLGCALAKIGQFAEAVAPFRKASELKPDDAEAYYNLGCALFEIGQLSAARAKFITVLKLNPAMDSRYNVSKLIEKTIEEERKNGLHENKKPDYNPDIIDGTTPTQARGTPEFRHKLQPLPEGLNWPREDYSQAPEYKSWGGIARYLERVWKPLLPYIDMPTLREHWPQTAKAIDLHRAKLPKELLPPLKQEVVDQELKKGWVRVEDAVSLGSARRRRDAQGGKNKPPSPG
jgi:Flp pilus assembly protein TadD